MNEIKKENPRTITKHRWCVIYSMWLDDARWGYTAKLSANQNERYTFWLEGSREPYGSIHLMMKSDGGPEKILQVLKFGAELKTIAKEMLAIGWNKWKIQQFGNNINSKI